MTLVNRTWGIVPLLILLLIVFSCTGSSEGKLIGTWKGSDYLFLKTSGEDVVVTINGGLTQHLSSKLILSEDGTYQKLVGEYDNGKGTWELKGNQLITKGVLGDEIYKLLKVTDKELVLTEDIALDTPKGKLSGKITLSYSR